MLSIKNTVTERKDILDGFIIRLDTAEERISGLGDISVEASKAEKAEREKTEEKKNRHSRTEYLTVRELRCNIHITGNRGRLLGDFAPLITSCDYDISIFRKVSMWVEGETLLLYVFVKRGNGPGPSRVLIPGSASFTPPLSSISHITDNSQNHFTYTISFEPHKNSSPSCRVISDLFSRHRGPGKWKEM